MSACKKTCPWCDYRPPYDEHPNDGDNKLLPNGTAANIDDLRSHMATCAVGKLRDEFAKAALPECIPDWVKTGDGKLDRSTARMCADEAYLFADAMLAARGAA